MDNLPGIAGLDQRGADLGIQVEGLAAHDLAERRQSHRNRNRLAVEDGLGVELRRGLETGQIERQLELGELRGLLVLEVEPAEVGIKPALEALRQGARAGALGRGGEAGGDRAGDRRLGTGLGRGGERPDVDAVHLHVGTQIQRLAGPIKVDVGGHRAAVEAELGHVGGQNAVLQQQAERDPADLVAHRLDPAQGQLDVGVGRGEAAEVDRLVRQRGQQIVWRLRRGRLARRLRRRGAGLRRRQVAADIELPALEGQSDLGPLARAVEAAAGGGVQAVTGDLRLFQGRLGAVAGEARADRQRPGVRLPLGQRIAEPGQ